MIRTFRAAVGVAVLLSVSTFAQAGPIRWGYRAEAPDGTILRETTGLTDLQWSDFFLPNPQQFGTAVPDPNPNGPLQTDIRRSSATVTIVDELSGQSGAFDIYADYIQQYEIKPDGSLYPVYEGEDGGPFWPDAGRLEIGGNVYRVRTPGGEFMVSVEPGPVEPPAATPEPGTLALAALGLGAVFARRLRRS